MSVYISALGINGGTFVENTGAMQGISNIAGVNHWKLYELWAEQKLLNESMSVLFGLYDLNSEFDVRESSGIFINPSFGIGFDFAQSGQNSPSIFPYTSLALRIKYSLSESFRIQTAIFDGVPGSLADEGGFHILLRNDEGALIATELIFSPSDNNYSSNYSKYSIGGWYYTSDFENAANGNYEKGNYGIYVSGEQLVYSENSSSEQGLVIFGRFGIANSNFNPSDYSVLGGLNYTGLFPNRDEDVIGIAFTSVHLDEQFKISEEINSAFETILELTYSLQMFDWIRLQPDIQFVFNPVFAKEADYAITTGIRAEVAF
jgi:porin